MIEVQIKAVERAVAMLSAAGAQYKVILNDGREYGALEIVPPKAPRTRTARVPYGSMRDFYKTKVDTTEVGGVVIISFAETDAQNIPRKNIRSAASAYASSVWGNGSYISAATDTHLELLRIA